MYSDIHPSIIMLFNLHTIYVHTAEVCHPVVSGYSFTSTLWFFSHSLEKDFKKKVPALVQMVPSQPTICLLGGLTCLWYDRNLFPNSNMACCVLINEANHSLTWPNITLRLYFKFSKNHPLQIHRPRGSPSASRSPVVLTSPGGKHLAKYLTKIYCIYAFALHFVIHLCAVVM